MAMKKKGYRSGGKVKRMMKGGAAGGEAQENDEGWSRRWKKAHDDEKRW